MGWINYGHVLEFTDTQTALIDGLGQLVYETTGRGTFTTTYGNAKVYRAVQFKDAVAYAAGHVVTFASANMQSVTNDRSGGSAITGLLPAGVCVSAPAQNAYGYVLVKGYTATCLTDGSVSAGEGLIPHASTDGAADSVSATYAVTTHNQVFGFAVSTDTVTNTDVIVNCQLW